MVKLKDGDVCILSTRHLNQKGITLTDPEAIRKFRVTQAPEDENADDDLISVTNVDAPDDARCYYRWRLRRWEGALDGN